MMLFLVWAVLATVAAVVSIAIAWEFKQTIADLDFAIAKQREKTVDWMNKCIQLQEALSTLKGELRNVGQNKERDKLVFVSSLRDARILAQTEERGGRGPQKGKAKGRVIGKRKGRVGGKGK